MIIGHVSALFAILFPTNTQFEGHSSLLEKTHYISLLVFIQDGH